MKRFLAINWVYVQSLPELAEAEQDYRAEYSPTPGIVFPSMYEENGGYDYAENPRSWIRFGSVLEDATSRPKGHFHEPISAEAGNGIHVTNQPGSMSTVEWGFGGDDPYEMGDTRGNQYSQSRLYDYLLGYYVPVEADGDLGTRDLSLKSAARFFRTLGHLSHLIQDMTQPSHTRNDAHLGHLVGDIGDPSAFEEWGLLNLGMVRDYAHRAPQDYPRLKRGREYVTSLANLSATHFFSDDTIGYGNYVPPYCTPDYTSWMVQIGKPVRIPWGLFWRDYQDFSIWNNAVPSAGKVGLAGRDRGLGYRPDLADWMDRWGVGSGGEISGPHPQQIVVLGQFATLDRNEVLDGNARALYPLAVRYCTGFLDHVFRAEITAEFESIVQVKDGPDLVTFVITNSARPPDGVNATLQDLYDGGLDEEARGKKYLPTLAGLKLFQEVPRVDTDRGKYFTEYRPLQIVEMSASGNSLVPGESLRVTVEYDDEVLKQRTDEEKTWKHYSDGVSTYATTIVYDGLIGSERGVVGARARHHDTPEDHSFGVYTKPAHRSESDVDEEEYKTASGQESVKKDLFNGLEQPRLEMISQVTAEADLDISSDIAHGEWSSTLKYVCKTSTRELTDEELEADRRRRERWSKDSRPDYQVEQMENRWKQADFCKAVDHCHNDAGRAYMSATRIVGILLPDQTLVLDLDVEADFSSSLRELTKQGRTEEQCPCERTGPHGRMQPWPYRGSQGGEDGGGSREDFGGWTSGVSQDDNEPSQDSRQEAEQDESDDWRFWDYDVSGADIEVRVDVTRLGLVEHSYMTATYWTGVLLAGDPEYVQKHREDRKGDIDSDSSTKTLALTFEEAVEGLKSLPLSLAPRSTNTEFWDAALVELNPSHHINRSGVGAPRSGNPFQTAVLDPNTVLVTLTIRAAADLGIRAEEKDALRWQMYEQGKGDWEKQAKVSARWTALIETADYGGGSPVQPTGHEDNTSHGIDEILGSAESSLHEHEQMIRRVESTRALLKEAIRISKSRGDNEISKWADPDFQIQWARENMVWLQREINFLTQQKALGAQQGNADSSE
ncbi:MAG: hypothetical protein D8M59_01790 [Planctomycetes bacterium]|nr:hypothetical protein [Planctomycetota bacterium]